MSGTRSIRYSSAFKLKVVEEIDSGTLTINQAMKVYGVGGHHTIQRWLKNLGRESLLPNTVRIQMKDELERIKLLERENALLKEALADKELALYLKKCEFEVMNEEYGLGTKKNIDLHALSARIQEQIAHRRPASGDSAKRTK
jgi:transposase-like protein